MRILYYGYRDWSIDLFKKLNSYHMNNIEMVFMSDKNLCDISIINALDPNIISGHEPLIGRHLKLISAASFLAGHSAIQLFSSGPLSAFFSAIFVVQ